MFKIIIMSKSILKMQAQELLGKEMRKITGGRFVDACTSCETCFASCSPGCNKKSITAAFE
jgi:heterodisulfide reductase subunit C